jgi:hypothetical protein
MNIIECIFIYECRSWRYFCVERSQVRSNLLFLAGVLFCRGNFFSVFDKFTACKKSQVSLIGVVSKEVKS